jgi:hypothetical protein
MAKRKSITESDHKDWKDELYDKIKDTDEINLIGTPFAEEVKFEELPKENIDPENSPETPENFLEEKSSPEIIETDKWIESEILFSIDLLNRETPVFDFTDALIKIDTITSIERLDQQRLNDIGVTESFIEDYDVNVQQSCLMYSSSYPDGVILIDHSYEEMAKILISIN